MEKVSVRETNLLDPRKRTKDVDLMDVEFPSSQEVTRPEKKPKREHNLNVAKYKEDLSSQRAAYVKVIQQIRHKRLQFLPFEFVNHLRWYITSCLRIL